MQTSKKSTRTQDLSHLLRETTLEWEGQPKIGKDVLVILKDIGDVDVAWTTITI